MNPEQIYQEYRKVWARYMEYDLTRLTDEEIHIMLVFSMHNDGAPWNVVEELWRAPHDRQTEQKQLVEVFQL